MVVPPQAFELSPAEDVDGSASLWARPGGNSVEGFSYEALPEALWGAAGGSLKWITYAAILSLCSGAC